MSAESLDASHVPDEDAANEGALYADLPPLEPKELMNETLHIKTKIRRAQKELEKLPDMQRTVEQQQEEIAELEERIQKQREMKKVLDSQLGDMGGSLG
jgi:predicted RNase H-like nuclease (RuvC/YqgF family)